MFSLEEQSFRNHVTFFRDELLHIHETGERGRYKSKKTWKNICDMMILPGTNHKKLVLTSKTLAVLCGLCELDKLDDDIGSVKLSELDVLKPKPKPEPKPTCKEMIKPPSKKIKKKKRKNIYPSAEANLNRSLSVKDRWADPTSGYHTEKYKLSLSSPARRANQSKAMLKHHAWKRLADVFEMLFMESG